MAGGASAALLALACCALPAPATDALMARGRAITASRPCPAATAEVVVCAPARPDRYRLPLPREAAPPTRGSLSTSEVLATPGACAPIGPRRCTKREAASMGLGNGRDPLSLAARLAGALLDPD